MKKLVYLFIAIFMGAHSLYAQDCATGYCPPTITVHHKVGDLSAVSGDITYEVVKITTTTVPTCWIARNLGATSAPTAVSDATSASAGWLYQVGLKQGNVVGSFNNVVTSMTLTSGGWPTATDPCTLTLGTAWHVPTAAQYIAAALTTPWSTSPKFNYNYGTYHWTGSGWGGNGWGAAYGACHVQDYYYSSTIIYWAQVLSAAAPQTYSAANAEVPMLPVRCVKTM